MLVLVLVQALRALGWGWPKSEECDVGDVARRALQMAVPESAWKFGVEECVAKTGAAGAVNMKVMMGRNRRKQSVGGFVPTVLQSRLLPVERTWGKAS